MLNIQLTGEISNIFPFRFHFWEEIEFYDPMAKQPYDGWVPGRFLGITWDSDDVLTYFVEPIRPGPGCCSVLT